MDDAARLEHPDVEFVPANPITEQNADKARAICGGCLCRNECLAYAQADNVLGIWAGATTAERKELRRRSAACVGAHLVHIASTVPNGDQQ